MHRKRTTSAFAYRSKANGTVSKAGPAASSGTTRIQDPAGAAENPVKLVDPAENIIQRTCTGSLSHFEEPVSADPREDRHSCMSQFCLWAERTLHRVRKPSPSLMVAIFMTQAAAAGTASDTQQQPFVKGESSMPGWSLLPILVILAAFGVVLSVIHILHGARHHPRTEDLTGDGDFNYAQYISVCVSLLATSAVFHDVRTNPAAGHVIVIASAALLLASAPGPSNGPTLTIRGCWFVAMLCSSILVATGYCWLSSPTHSFSWVQIFETLPWSSAFVVAIMYLPFRLWHQFHPWIYRYLDELIVHQWQQQRHQQRQRLEENHKKKSSPRKKKHHRTSFATDRANSTSDRIRFGFLPSRD